MATDVQRGGNVDPGAVESSSFSMDYARAKMREFQGTLVAIDQTAQSLRDALQWATDAESISVIQTLLDDYESKRRWVKLTAEGANAAAASINALGGRMPEVSIPAGLGAWVPVGWAAAVAAVAAVISWGVAWVATADARIRALADSRVTDARIEVARQSDDPSGELATIAREQAAVNETLARLDQARGGLTQLPGQVFDLLKLAALGVAGWMLWRAFEARRDAD